MRGGLAKEPLCKICRILCAWEKKMRGSIRKWWEKVGRCAWGTGTEGTPGRAADEPESESKELEDGMYGSHCRFGRRWVIQKDSDINERSLQHEHGEEQVDNEIKGPDMKANAVIRVWSDRDKTKPRWRWQMWQVLWRSITRTDWHSGTVILNTRSRS